MARQQMTVATVAGEAGRMVAALFRKWHSTQADDRQDDARRAVDEFAEQLRTRGGMPPIVYYCEWFDYWLMGDDIHLGKVAEGNRFSASCGSREEAMAWTEQCGNQFPERQYLAMHLREASEAWQSLAEPAVVVILRQVLGPSVTDEEVMASLSDASIFSDIAVNEM
jgi:hypothetical protein